MKTDLTLFDILQNTGISVIALHSFVLGYNNVAKHKQLDKQFPPMSQMFYILPIIYDSKAMESIKFEIYTTLAANPSITLGLQDRACKMSQQTFDALNLGLSKNILKLNTEYFTIELGEEMGKDILTQMNLESELLKKIRTTSKRLGSIFAKKDQKMLQLTLNIRF